MAAYVAAVGPWVHGASGNLVVTLPSGGADAPQAGDQIYLNVPSGDNIAHTVTGYTLIAENNSGTTHKQSVWYKIAAGGDGNPTVTHAAGNTIAAQAIIVRGGVASGTPYSAATSLANASSLSISFTGLTPGNGELVLMLATSGDLDTSTATIYSAPSGTNPTFTYNGGLTNQAGDGTAEIGAYCGWGVSADGTATGSRTLTQDKARPSVGTLISIISGPAAGPVPQDKGVEQSGIANITVPWPPHAVGDVALLIIESAGGQAANLGTANGFAAVTNSPQATGATTAGTQLTVYWCRATSTSMASPVVTDPGDHVYGVIVTFRGCPAAGNPWNITAGSVKAGATTTTTWDSVTTTVPNTLVLNIASRDTDSAAAAWSVFAGGNCTSLGEWHDSGTTQGNGGGIVVNLSRLAAAGATGAPTCTVASSINAEMTIALRSGLAPPFQPRTARNMLVRR